MKSFDALIGMQVTGLDLKWAKRHEARPNSGLFLMFEDGTYFEFQSVQGYLEMGRHVPSQAGEQGDPRLASHYLSDSGRLPPLLKPHEDSGHH